MASNPHGKGSCESRADRYEHERFETRFAKHGKLLCRRVHPSAARRKSEPEKIKESFHGEMNGA